MTGGITVVWHEYKTGVFSGLGHEQEVKAPIHNGTAETGAHPAVELQVNARELRVIDKDESEKDRAEVQETMLGPDVLDTEHHPEIGPTIPNHRRKPIAAPRRCVCVAPDADLRENKRDQEIQEKRKDERPDPNRIRGTRLCFTHVFERHPPLAEQPVEPKPSEQPVNNRANNHRRVVRSHRGTLLYIVPTVWGIKAAFHQNRTCESSQDSSLTLTFKVINGADTNFRFGLCLAHHSLLLPWSTAHLLPRISRWAPREEHNS
jgi:hypothetical protein